MNFDMIMQSQNMLKRQDCYMDRDSIIIHVKMLKQNLTVEILN